MSATVEREAAARPSLGRGLTVVLCVSLGLWALCTVLFALGLAAERLAPCPVIANNTDSSNTGEPHWSWSDLDQSCTYVLEDAQGFELHTADGSTAVAVVPPSGTHDALAVLLVGWPVFTGTVLVLARRRLAEVADASRPPGA